MAREREEGGEDDDEDVFDIEPTATHRGVEEEAFFSFFFAFSATIEREFPKIAILLKSLGLQ